LAHNEFFGGAAAEARGGFASSARAFGQTGFDWTSFSGTRPLVAGLEQGEIGGIENDGA
jgi:hypothetical protein